MIRAKISLRPKGNRLELQIGSQLEKALQKLARSSGTNSQEMAVALILAAAA